MRFHNTAEGGEALPEEVVEAYGTKGELWYHVLLAKMTNFRYYTYEIFAELDKYF